jgi:hypothetical protein
LAGKHEQDWIFANFRQEFKIIFKRTVWDFQAIFLLFNLAPFHPDDPVNAKNYQDYQNRLLVNSN